MRTKDVLIGLEEESLGSFSCHVYGGRDRTLIDNISYNNRLFWLTSKLFGVRILLARDCEGGKQLTQMLEDESVSSEDIINEIDDMAMKYSSLTQLRQLIEQEKKEAYRRGQEDIKMQFRRLISV